MGWITIVIMALGLLVFLLLYRTRQEFWIAALVASLSAPLVLLTIDYLTPGALGPLWMIGVIFGFAYVLGACFILWLLLKIPWKIILNKLNNRTGDS